MTTSRSSILRGCHHAFTREQHGIALVLVLWLLMLLTVIANSVALTSRTEIQITSNQLASAKVEAIADAAVHKAIYELLAPIDSQKKWQSDGQDHDWSFGDINVRVSIRDEGAKVDLNTAPSMLLSGLFGAIGAAKTSADTLADAVVDWRDPDNLRRLNGAEREDYLAAGRSYGPANASFNSIEELRLVLGMNEDLYRAIKPYVTVHTQSNTINSTMAERPVLLALPGTTPAQVDRYIEERKYFLEQGLPPPPFLSGGDPKRTDYYCIRAEAYSGDNTSFNREAVVRITGNAAKPFAILAWRILIPESSISHPASF